jgi:ribosomal protein S27E
MNSIVQLAELFNNLKDTDGKTYLNPNWVMRTLVIDTLYCPKCFENKIEFDRDTFYFSCKNCGRINASDLLSKEEAISTKRTKTIDNIINEQEN